MKKYNLIFGNLHIFISVYQISCLENARSKVHILIFAIQNCCDPASQTMARDGGKVLHILQLKYSVRFV